MILEQYVARHPKSRELYEQAQRVFPSGVTHDRRYIEPFPLFMARGEGAHKWDVDGNRYIDYVGGHGALLLGHSHPAVVQAVSRQAALGTHLGANTRAELAWARAVQALMPSVERIRFHSSGTEATLMALRLARAWTGRNRIIKFRHHFHGWHDCVSVGAANYSPAGIPRQTEEAVTVLPAGDLDRVEQALGRDHDVAAVILEPTGAKAGALPLDPAFLQPLRELTESRGVVLVFDEVVTGFRLSPGGAQERFGVRPDLTALAKVLAGGLPGGAVGGKAEIVDLIAFRSDARWNAEHRVTHPGTFNANPLSAAAGSACLELIAREPVSERAERSAARLRSGLNQALKDAGVRGFVYGLASSLNLAFGLEYEGDLDCCTVESERLLAALLSPVVAKFHRAMLNEGVDLMGGHWWVVSAAHGEAEIDQTVAAFRRALDKLKAEELLP